MGLFDGPAAGWNSFKNNEWKSIENGWNNLVNPKWENGNRNSKPLGNDGPVKPVYVPEEVVNVVEPIIDPNKWENGNPNSTPIDIDGGGPIQPVVIPNSVIDGTNKVVDTVTSIPDTVKTTVTGVIDGVKQALPIIAVGAAALIGLGIIFKLK